MKTFTTFLLTETLGTPVQWTWENNVSPDKFGYRRHRAFFQVKENDYRITMSLRGMNQWDVTFALLRDPQWSKDMMGGDEIVSPYGDTTDKVPFFGVMHTGSSFIVFATVVAILKEFVAAKKPLSLHFDAMAEPSRVKLYQRLVQMAPQINPRYHSVRTELIPRSGRLRNLADDEFIIQKDT